MAYPTTLALITALWSGPARTGRSRSGRRSAARSPALGPLLSGALLEQFDWGSVFLVTLPLAVVALVLAWRFVPAHVNETTDPVDNLGGILSIVLVAALVLAINLAAVPGKGTLASAWRRRPRRRRSPSSSASAARTRSTTSRSPAAGSSGSPPWPGSSSSAR